MNDSDSRVPHQSQTVNPKPHGNFIDRTGIIYGRLKVVRLFGKKRGRWHWECLCECGNTPIVEGSCLGSHNTNSCGCLALEIRTKHGLLINGVRPPEYNVWLQMKARCLNPKHIEFHNYGGRGITVCAEWVNSFQRFIEDMGFRPSDLHSIDRIKNNGNYQSDNCRWALDEVQQNNTRKNKFLTMNGRTQTVSQWAREVGIKPSSIDKRIRLGWSIEKVLQNKKLRV